jgi:hypothetical protein
MKKQTRVCACGKTYEVSGAYKPRTCPDCNEARLLAMPNKTCKLCGKADIRCYRHICRECRKTQHQTILDEWEREGIERRRTRVEQYVEMYMQRHSPDADSLTPRQLIAFDRKWAAKYSHLTDNEFDEFYALVFVLAYKQDILTAAWWHWFRHVRDGCTKYREAVAVLHHEVWGKPSHW